MRSIGPLVSRGGGRAPSIAWQQQAKCSGRGTDEFFPDDRVDVEHAKAFCRGTYDDNPCPVQEACLAYARAMKTRHGVWGGRYFKPSSHSEKEKVVA